MALTGPTPHSADAELAHEEARADETRRRAIFAIVGAFVLILGVIVAVQWLTDGEESAEGKPLPEADLITLEGEDFPLSSIVGTPTVVNFFASWCAPCRAELPEFQEVSERVRGRGVSFLGVNTRETDVEQARDLIDATGVTYTVVLGDDGSLFEAFEGLAMPTTAFVDASGTIVEVHSGVLRGEDLESKITEHFG